VYWLLQQSLSGLETYFRLADRRQAGTLVGNRDALHAAPGETHAPVVPRLEIDDPLFDLDLFQDGATFVSRRLADAMALPPHAAVFGDVDDRACAAPVRARGYRVMELLAHGDALDRDASDGELVEVPQPGGGVASEWMLAAPEPNRPAPCMVWRSGFEPPADLFLVEGTHWHVATEALAVRIVAAEAVGVDLVDPVASAEIGKLVLRRP